MQTQPFHQLCRCDCGASQLVVHATPRAHYFCHCTICQEVGKKAYCDSTALRAEEVSMVEGHKLTFKEYGRKGGVSRGTCTSCGSFLVGFVNLLPGIRAAFVAGDSYPQPAALPAPRMHIFYDRRVADVADALPKYSGTFSSQLHAAPMILGSMLRRPASRSEA